MDFNLSTLNKIDETLFYLAVRKIKKLNLNSSNIFKKVLDRVNNVYTFDQTVYHSKESIMIRNNEVVNMVEPIEVNDHYIDCMILILLAFKYEKPNDYNVFMMDYMRNSQKLENKVNLKEVLDKINSLSTSNIAKIKPIINFSKMEVNFKIVISREYSIMDVNNFISLVLEKNSLSYGKSVNFNHDLNNFDSQGQLLIKLMIDSFGSIKEDKKTIKLNPIMVDRLFKIMQGEVLKDINNDVVYCMLNDTELKVKLSNNILSVVNKNKIIKGYDFMYIILNKVLYKVSMPLKVELKVLYDYLVNNDIDLNHVEDEFVNSIYYQIFEDLEIEDSFKRKHPLQSIKLDSYFDVNKSSVVVKFNVLINDDVVKVNDEIIKNNVYFNNRLNDYKTHIINLGFNEELNNTFRTNDVEILVNFDKINLNTIRQYGNVFISEELKKEKITTLPKFNIAVKYDVDLLSFKLVNNDLEPKDIKTIIDAYKKKQKFVKLDDDMYISLDKNVSDFVNILEDFSLDIDNLFDEEKKPYSHVLKLLNESNDYFTLDQKLDDIVYDLRNYKDATFEIPNRFKDIMRPYQKEAFLWMKTLIKYRFGGILADEMGLGKTLEVISVLSSDEVNRPILVVCPTSLIYNWSSEIKKWDENLITIPLIGTQPFRKKIIESIPSDKKIIYIASYDVLKKDINLYKDVDFRLVIADEAHFIKNRQTLKSDAVKKLKADVKFSLTGTPIENSLADLWSIFDFVMPGYLSSYNNFKERYESLIVNKDKEALDQLMLRIMPFILRRTKKEVLKDLPDKFETVYHVDLTDEQQKLYEAYYLDAINDLDGKSHITVLSLILRLRQICVDPALFLENYEAGSAKIDLAIELLSQYTSSGHKVLLFSQFPSIFEKISNRLKELNIESFTLTGKTKAEERMNLVNEFNSSTDVNVFLISLKAGGTGLNLTSADTVIHLDPWWNLSVENQASDRAHRLGQVNKVQVVKIVCANTIEQKVIELQKVKQDLANSIMDSNKSMDTLTKEDIKNIFSR